MRFDRILRVAIAATLLAACGALFVVQGVYTERSASRRIGVDLQPHAGALVVSQLTSGLPAERAGLEAGDVLLAVGGKAIGPQSDYERAAAGFVRGRPVSFTVSRQGRILDLAVTPGAEPRWGLLALNGVSTLAYLAIALLALKKSRVSLQARLLFGFTAAVALEMAMPINALGSGLWIGAVAAFYLLTGSQMALELHLATIIPDRPPWLASRRFIVPFYYAVGLGLGAASCAAFLFDSFGLSVLPWTSTQADLVVLRWGLPVWAGAVTLLLASQALRHPEPRGRHQAGLVLAATIPWLLFVVGTNLAEHFGYDLPVWTPALEGLILLAYPVAFFVAIFLYDLFDIELAVRRGLIYTTLTGTLVLLSYAALGAGGMLFSNLVEGRPSVWAVSAATLLLGLLFSPLRRLVKRTIDRRFFPERHAMRQRLIALAGELPALGKLPRMGRHLVSRLRLIFGARTAMLLIADPDQRLLGVLAAALDGDTTGGHSRPLLLALGDPGVEHLRRAGRPLPASQLLPHGASLLSRLTDLEPTDLAVPLVHQGQLSGVLIVGSKKGGDPYSTEEQELLNLVAHHAAAVFENARLFESATYESLTGLLRREAILEQLEREIDRGLRYGRPLAVAMADLDHFREINERYGHLGGDTLLKRIAEVLSQGLRSTDWIGRYGGEEFLLVLPETDMDGASAVAEKVRYVVQATSVPMEDGARARVTISIGLATLAQVASTHPGAVTPRDLIAAADRSLYQAKHAGRNQVFPKVA